MKLFKIPVFKITVHYDFSYGMVVSSCRYQCGFVYGWYHAITKHKFMQFCRFLLFSKFSIFKLKSLSPLGGLQIVLKIKFLHFLFKTYMLKDSTSSKFIPRSCLDFKGQRFEYKYTYPSTPATFSYLMENIITRQLD